MEFPPACTRCAGRPRNVGRSWLAGRSAGARTSCLVRTNRGGWGGTPSAGRVQQNRDRANDVLLLVSTLNVRNSSALTIAGALAGACSARPPRRAVLESHLQSQIS